MGRTPMQLDEPSTLRRGSVVFWISLATVYLLVALAVSRLPPDPLVELPGVALAHATAMAVIAFVTAALLLANASRSGNVGYLFLAGVFIVVLALNLAWPLAFPGSVLTDDQGRPERLLGGEQSPISIFYEWHVILYVGLPVSVYLLVRSARSTREHLSALQIAGAVLLSVACAALLVVWDLFTPGRLPVLTGPDGITELAQRLDWVLLALAVGGCVFIVAYTRERTSISRWITGVAVLSIGEAVVNVGVERYSAGWYFTRTFGLLAMSALLLALVWETARVDRVALVAASRDSLTRTRSRALFESDLATEVARAVDEGQPLALLWIDVDNFKSVNDRFGHRSGDHVLREISARIGEQIRTTDLLARMGGDEFAVALPGVGSRSVAEGIAERIVGDLAEPIEIGGAAVYTSCSIGLAYVPHDATGAEELSHKADIAMYEAKASGGGRFVAYRAGLEERARETAELRSALIQAIERGEFEPFLQPIVDAASRQIVGFEVLARWRRDGGLVDAASFIDLAEGSGLIVPIGQQVRAAVLTHLPALFAAHGALDFVSLNLSVQELMEAAGGAELGSAAWLAWHDRLVLEVTESQALDADGPANSAITDLMALGYRIGVDDFGVGFSTIVRLEQVLPYLMKTDRSLLARSTAPGVEPRAMLRWAHDIAQMLGSRLVVEGVETSAEDEVVQSMDAVLAQGFYYGHPAPMSQWLAATH